MCLCAIGVLPQFLQEKVPAVMGCDPGVLSPHDELEDLDPNSGMKRRRRSFGGTIISSGISFAALFVETVSLPSFVGLEQFYSISLLCYLRRRSHKLTVWSSVS